MQKARVRVARLCAPGRHGAPYRDLPASLELQYRREDLTPTNPMAHPGDLALPVALTGIVAEPAAREGHAPLLHLVQLQVPQFSVLGGDYPRALMDCRRVHEPVGHRSFARLDHLGVE